MFVHVSPQMGLRVRTVVAEVTLDLLLFLMNRFVMLRDAALAGGTHTASRKLALVSFPVHVSGRERDNQVLDLKGGNRKEERFLRTGCS